MSTSIQQPYMAERWFALLVQAVESDPRGRAGVAEHMQAAGEERVSRVQISLVLDGVYPASTERLAAKVLAVFDRHDCPYLGEPVTNDTCRQANAGPPPTWDPAALDQRRVCQNCPHHPSKGEHA